MAVPRIIHQLWKDAAIPERYWALCESWRRHHPDWEHKLWTDADLARLVDLRFPQLKSLYDGYARGISRADLGRYLVMAVYGGVYADLDCECLKPVGPLVEGDQVVFGLEPADHAKVHGVDNVICISFIASPPGRPFWNAVIEQARQSAGEAEVLKQTGPLMMNRAYRGYADKAAIRLLPPALVYPFSYDEAVGGAAHDIEVWERATRGAYVAHYWDTSWTDAPSTLADGLPQQAPVEISPGPLAHATGREPFIACLMRSSGRLADARDAIDDFTAQTYGRRELIVGASEIEPDLRAFAESQEGVRVVEAAPPTRDDPPPLDIALLAAAGDEVVCAWEEGVRHDPRRLAVQQQTRAKARAHLVMLSRRMIWRPADGRIGVGATGGLAGTVMGDADALRTLARTGSDMGAWRRALGVGLRVATLDLPRLTLAIDESDDPAAFEAVWAQASVRFPPERTMAVAHKLADRLAIPPRLFASGASPRGSGRRSAGAGDAADARR